MVDAKDISSQRKKKAATGVAISPRAEIIKTETDRKSSLVDQAYELIRTRILDNVYPPGHQALESDLANELGISRTPLREALIRVQKEGLVEVIPRHGMRVLPVSPSDMKELYEILTALEGLAVELVAQRHPTEEDLRPLILASKDMTAALKQDDLDAWAEADERFHSSLVHLSGNQLLVKSVMNFWDRAHRARMFTLRLRPKPINSTKEHMALVEALRSGQLDVALQINKAHRARGCSELLAILEKYRMQHV